MGRSQGVGGDPRGRGSGEIPGGSWEIPGVGEIPGGRGRSKGVGGSGDPRR